MAQRQPEEDRSQEEQSSPLTALFEADLLRVLDIKAGEKVLQLGAGTGDLALAARRHGAEVTVADTSQAMIERLRLRLAIEPEDLGDIRVELMSGAGLNRPDESYDKAVAILAMVSFSNREEIFRELHRVVKSGGTAAIVTWTGPDRTRIFPLFFDAFEHIMADTPATMDTPVPWILADGNVLASEMRETGFQNVRLEYADHVWKAPSARAFWEGGEGTVMDVASLISLLGPGKVDTLRAQFLDVLQKAYGIGPLELRAQALIGMGVKKAREARASAMP